MADDIFTQETVDKLNASALTFNEVVTSRAGGVASGAIIDQTLTPLGDTTDTLKGRLDKLGVYVSGWTSTDGGTLTSPTQAFLNNTSGSTGFGNYYSWSGAYPIGGHVVAPGTDPAAVGSGYTPRTDVALRSQLASETGSVLIGVGPGRTQSDKNEERVSLGDFSHLISGSDYTAAAQAAINHAAFALKEVDFSGYPTITVTSLSLPSNTYIYLGGSTLKRANGSNQPLLKNANISYSAGSYGNENIRITDGVLDFNGLNQSDIGTDGAWLVGVKFAGVNGLFFESVTTKNSRRFNVFICNCTKIRSYGTEIINDPLIPSANKDGFHINGNVSDFYADVITLHHSEDDAFALNADDIDFGGDMTTSNICGPIDDIKVGMIRCVDTRNGVRLLSATNRIRNVQIDNICGDVSVYALNIQDYGLGAASWYQDIKIGSIDCTFNQRPYPEATMAMVNVEMPNHSPDAYSNIEICRIHRYQNDVDGQDRPTVNYTARRSELHIGTISEFNCSHKYSTVMTGAKEGTKLILDRFQRWASRVSDGIYGSVVKCVGATLTVDMIEVANIQADRLQHLVLLQNSAIGELSIDTLTPTDSAPIYLADSSIDRLFWKSNSKSSYGLSSARYSLNGSSSVAFERPAPLGGNTSDRPTNAAYGDSFFDLTIGKPIWWSGSWKDSTGAPV